MINRVPFRRCIIVILFLILTFAMTYPLFPKINNSISGFSSTDEPSVWYFWWLKYAHISNIDHRNCQYLAYPFGQDYGGFDLLYPMWSLFKRAMAITTNHFFAYNIEVVLSFVLSGLFAYLLTMFVSGNSLVSFFAGTIYTFSPYHFARAWQHIGLVHIQWMPLYMYALLKIKDKSSWKAVIFLSFALFLVASFDYYYLYFMLLVTFFFLVYRLITDRKNNRKLIAYIISGMLLASLPMVSMLWQFIKTRLFSTEAKAVSVWSLYRPFEDLFVQSARPLSYFLPSTEHPLLGWITRNFIGTDMYGMSFTEHSIYLGWIPLLLAFFAFKKWRLRRKQPLVISHQSADSSKDDFYIGFFVFLAFASWLFSQPPWWNVFGFKLYMPSFFLYKIAPMFRAYCRFGIVVMLAVAVLAGYGLKFILERFKSRKAKAAVTALFCALVLFEFWNYPPFKVIDLSKVPAVYYWLKDEPKDIVIAEYPLDADSPSELYKFFQTVHEKKIINGTIPGTYANKVAQAIKRLSSPQTASVLKWMGVKYAIVHKDEYLKTDLIEDREDLEGIYQSPDLKFVKSFSPQECPQKGIMCAQKTGVIDVYEVAAEPIEPKVE